MNKLLNKFSLLGYSVKIMILIGVLGLFPFIFGLVDLWVNKNELLFKINLPKYYGAIILTFLGSKYWGIILNLHSKNKLSNQLEVNIIIWSILPSIIGIIVLSIQNSFSIIILAFGFILSQIIDELLYNRINLPYWYLMLRRALTSLVLVILICTYIIIK
ncbi:DUF3429 domain-containing protein [Alphaproteobacteria bacterium]|nr:DUF3429 domain-containing protein [Alphaproteobacteria bacterium]